MGASYSQNSSSRLCKRQEKIKICFTKAMERELMTNLPALSQMKHAEMVKHFKVILDTQCLKPNHIDCDTDPWAKTTLQLTACSISQAIIDGCAKAGIIDRRRCGQEAALKCLKTHIANENGTRKQTTTSKKTARKRTVSAKKNTRKQSVTLNRKSKAATAPSPPKPKRKKMLLKTTPPRTSTPVRKKKMVTKKATSRR